MDGKKLKSDNNHHKSWEEEQRIINEESLVNLKRKYEDLLKINNGITKANRRMFETIQSIKNTDYYSELKNKMWNLKEEIRVLREREGYLIWKIRELGGREDDTDSGEKVKK